MFRFFKTLRSALVPTTTTRRLAEQRAFRPLCEDLEDRQLMSVTITNPTADKLVIKSDSAGDKVTIRQNDATNDLYILVSGLNGFTQEYNSSDITKIVVRMGGGNDELIYDLGESDFTNAKTIKIDMGAGDDDVNFHLHQDLTSSATPSLLAPLTIKLGVADGDIPAPDNSGKEDVHLNMGFNEGAGTLNLTAKLGPSDDEFSAAFWATVFGDVTVDVNGGAGLDTLKAGGEYDIFGLGQPSDNAFAIGPDAEVKLKLDGATDADKVAVSYEGLLLGRLTLDALGGAGTATVTGHVELAGGKWLTSTGKLDAYFGGGDNPDTLNFWLGGKLDAATLV